MPHPGAYAGRAEDPPPTGDFIASCIFTTHCTEPYASLMETKSVLPVVSQIFARPKAGNAPEEYEDAAAIGDDRWPLRAAVADGATETSYSRLWAEILTEGIAEEGIASADRLKTVLPQWQAQWDRDVNEKIENMPWYGAEKAADGAFATLLGLNVHEDNSWTALSVGDCVLFHLSDDELQQAWPIEDPRAFTHRPELLPSRDGREAPSPAVTEGEWEVGDAFILATDAAAQWLLRTDPAAVLEFDENRFRLATDSARGTGGLRNDDSTIVLLEMRAPEEDE